MFSTKSFFWGVIEEYSGLLIVAPLSVTSMSNVVINCQVIVSVDSFISMKSSIKSDVGDSFVNFLLELFKTPSKTGVKSKVTSGFSPCLKSTIEALPSTL